MLTVSRDFNDPRSTAHTANEPIGDESQLDL